MNAPVPTPGRFEAVLASAKREASTPPTTFEPCRDGVLMHIGPRTVLLTPQQVTDLMGLYERERQLARAEAERCDRLYAGLWSARCDALDRCGAAAA